MSSSGWKDRDTPRARDACARGTRTRPGRPGSRLCVSKHPSYALFPPSSAVAVRTRQRTLRPEWDAVCDRIGRDAPAPGALSGQTRVMCASHTWQLHESQRPGQAPGQGKQAAMARQAKQSWHASADCFPRLQGRMQPAAGLLGRWMDRFGEEAATPTHRFGLMEVMSRALDTM